ncbi:MAG: beta-N-acetylhexosaminidase, partial [Gammaproteobacteria bacterium]
GFILFSRNIADPAQLKALIEELNGAVTNTHLHVLVDQEGGRVRRLKPPHFQDAKAAKTFRDLAETDLDKAKDETFNAHFNMGLELKSLGFTMNCAPVADIFYPWAHDIIGDRSFGSTPQQVAELCKSALNGLNKAGIAGIVKHIPGHGRALSDSHFELPRVNTSLTELEATDFEAFKLLNDAPFAMTAHVVYEALDPLNPATTSSIVIDYIRNQLGFKGAIMSDDLAMKALSGTPAENAKAALAAGCDLLLHCNGNMNEMVEIVKEIM